MAKKDDNNDPIEFRVSYGSYNKRDWAPTPINKPNWIYKRYSRTRVDFFEWSIIGILLFVAIMLGIFLIANSMFTSPLWIVVIVMGIPVILVIRSAVASTVNHRSKTENEENQNTTSPRKREKKLPKHRKDYK